MQTQPKHTNKCCINLQKHSTHGTEQKIISQKIAQTPTLPCLLLSFSIANELKLLHTQIFITEHHTEEKKKRKKEENYIPIALFPHTNRQINIISIPYYYYNAFYLCLIDIFNSKDYMMK